MANKLVWKYEHYSTLSSTNDYCIEIAKLGHKTNLAVLADVQTKARGSRGRKWIEQKGNLAFSLLYWPENKNFKNNWIAFVAALALYDAIQFFVHSGQDLIIKWPNDLLYQGKKIAGILVESNLSTSNYLEWLVIGFGVNIETIPQIDRAVGCIRDIIPNPPSAYALSKKIIDFFEYWTGALLNHKEAIIREAWLKKSVPLYSSLSIHIGGKVWKGNYCGIDEHGLLLLQIEKELKHFSTGEIFWLYNS